MVSIDDVKHVASLAKLNLTAKEIDLMQKQLNKILGYIDLIKGLDTDKVKPTHHIQEDTINIFQSNKVGDFDREVYFEHINNNRGNYITTKKVLDY